VTRPFACAFCGATLDATRADALMGLLDCEGCGKLAQLDAAAVSALAQAPAAGSRTVSLAAPNCQRCKSQLKRAQLAPEYGIARCDCGIVNDLGARYRSAKAQHAHAPKTDGALAKRLPNPGAFVVRELPGALDISWRAFKPIQLWAVPPMVTLALALAAGLRDLVGYGAIWTAAVIGGGVALVWAFGATVSRIHITASKETLRVSRHPVPWFTRSVAREALTQLFVKEETLTDSHGNAHTFWFLAALRKGSDKPLLLTPACDDPSMPRFLEQQLERYLGIKDRPVAGEWG
jgi:hypothetical protein